MEVYIYIYCILLLIQIADFARKKQRIIALLLTGFIMTLFVGFRGETGADSTNYITFFKDSTDTIWSWKNLEKGYSEYGFYYLSVLLKSIWNNVDFYFLSISFLTITFLAKSLRRYSLYPLLGFCVYYSRFLISRDMNQIRQALAVVILIYGLHYLIIHRKRIFIFYLFVSAMIHYSSLAILPFVWLYNRKISLKCCVWLLIWSGIGGIVGGTLIKSVLTSTGNVFMLTYVNTENLGISNPVVLYQVILCILFFYYEPLLYEKQKGYYVIRNAYLYSIVLLLLTCNLGEIGGRLATIFATCEIFIIPALAYVVKPRFCGYLISLSVTTLLFALNYQKFLELPEVWSYF